MAHHLDSHRKIKDFMQALVNDAPPAFADFALYYVFSNSSVGRMATAIETACHQFGKKASDIGVLIRDTLEILLTQFPADHVCFSINVCGAGFAGYNGHFSKNFPILNLLYIMCFPLF